MIWLSSVVLYLHILGSIVPGIPVAALGGALIGPTGNKMAAAGSKEEVQALAARMSTYGRLESALFLVLLALMVVMHTGY